MKIRKSKTIQNMIEKSQKEVYKNLPIMEGSSVEVRKNTPSTAQIIKSHVCDDDCGDIKINDNDYYTVSFHKDIELEDGDVISKIVRVHIEDGDIIEIFESK